MTEVWGRALAHRSSSGTGFFPALVGLQIIQNFQRESMALESLWIANIAWPWRPCNSCLSLPKARVVVHQPLCQLKILLLSHITYIARAWHLQMAREFHNWAAHIQSSSIIVESSVDGTVLNSCTVFSQLAHLLGVWLQWTSWFLELGRLPFRLPQFCIACILKEPWEDIEFWYGCDHWLS